MFSRSIRSGVYGISRFRLQRILSRRFVASVPLQSRDNFANFYSVSTPEDAVKYIESLALQGCNRMETIQDSTYLLDNHAKRMYPLQIVRALNAYSHMNFSNKTILTVAVSRSEEMCESASPRRALELLTLYKSLNLSHKELLDPVAKALVNHMNNYSYELYTLGLNASYLNMDDPVFVESLKTQTLLKMNEISPLNAIKNIASFSRFRVEPEELVEEFWNSELKEKLNMKKMLLLLSAFARFRDDRTKFFSDAIAADVEKRELSVDDVSTILTLQIANRVVHLETIYTIINWIELNLKDPGYVKSHLIYHVFTLAQLITENPDDNMWKLVLDRLMSSIEGFLQPSKMIQLLYSVAILKSKNAIGGCYEEMLSQIRATHLKLTLKEQELLYDSVSVLYGEKEDEVVRKILGGKMPNRLPLMYGNMRKVSFGRNGGKNLLYRLDEDKKLVAQRCVNESHALNVVDKNTDVVLSPAAELDLKVVRMLESTLESHSEEVEIVVPNEGLRRELNLG